MKYDAQESKIRYEQKKQQCLDEVKALLEQDPLDEDGYPSESALMAIEKWHFSDPKGWFEFIKSIWHLASWGWSERLEDHEFKENTTVYRYHISTAGWSGNESIVRAMEVNEFMWHLNWVQSRRGGHYIFELYELQDD